MALAIASCDKDNTGANDVSDIAPDGYVDLGLTSGTKWKTTNETRPNDTCDFYTYDEAVAKFGDNLPTIEQFLEIGNECRWTFTDSGYVAVGKNGHRRLLLVVHAKWLGLRLVHILQFGRNTQERRIALRRAVSAPRPKLMGGGCLCNG